MNESDDLRDVIFEGFRRLDEKLERAMKVLGQSAQPKKSEQAYQVIANIAQLCGVFEAPEVERALDYFGDAERYDPEFLPWRPPIERTLETQQRVRRDWYAEGRMEGYVCRTCGMKGPSASDCDPRGACDWQQACERAEREYETKRAPGWARKMFEGKRQRSEP